MFYFIDCGWCQTGFLFLLNRISESLCEVEGDFDDDVDGVIDDGVRCDTRATNEVETISISSVGEVRNRDRERKKENIRKYREYNNNGWFSTRFLIFLI